MKTKRSRIKVQAECASFDITVTAQVESSTLVAQDMDDVKRKLKHELAKTIAGLPFAHVYPFEVRVQ
jgi:hypothetical protein